MEKRCRWTVLLLVLLLAIAIVVAAVVVIPILKTLVMNEKLKDEFVLEEGNTLFGIWKSPDIGPMYKTFTMYSVKNPDQAMKGAKIELTEMGPYYFKEFRRKFSPNFTADGTIVHYKQNKYYVFDRNRTGSQWDPDVDRMTTVNAVLATVIKLYLNKEVRGSDAVLAMMISNLFVTHTVSEFLWGYTDLLIKLANKKNLYPRTNFSLQINNSASDYLQWSAVKTGKGNSDDIGDFVEWDGMPHLDYWNGTYANMINGTEGFLFRSGLKLGDNLTVFVDDLFRSANLTCNQMAELESISLLRCVIPQWELQNATVNPKNAEWYANTYSGLLNESSANYRAPIFISKPHYLDVDPEVATNITGLRGPDRQLDDTFLDIEPITGALFRTFKRLQANIQIQPITHSIAFEKVSKVRHTFVPIFFAEESVLANTTTCNLFKTQVYEPIDVIRGVQWGLVGLGGLVIVLCIIVGARMIYKRKDDEQAVPLLDSSDIS
ncbi:lysosome membrane protein 2-like [Oscarella lobularis]|uniref:lysosome membrane protein 2-like n=1 Tax=Oscarella lobularis TaxID=121494 RepID=UPI003313FB4F